MESIHLIIHDTPWRFLIPIQAIDISRISISASFHAERMQGQISSVDLAEWLRLERQYELQIEGQDDDSPLAMVHVRLLDINHDPASEQVLLKFQPVRGLEELEEYVNFRQNLQRS